jgi:hypothetical protein
VPNQRLAECGEGFLGDLDRTWDKEFH